MRFQKYNTQTMLVSDFCKRYLKEYLSARWVLVMDWFISVFATFIVLELINFFVRVGGRFFVVALIVSAVASFVMMLAFGTYRRAIRHTQLRDISRFGFMFMSAEVCVLVTLLLTFPNFWKVIVIGSVWDFCVSMVLAMGVRAFMMLLYMKISETQKENINRILVYRTGDKPVSLVKRLEQSPHYQLVGFLTRDKIENRMMVEGKPVFLIHDDYVPGDKKSSKYAASAPEFDGVLFASEEDVQNEKERLVEMLIRDGKKILITPTIDEVVDGVIKKKGIREVKIEDLLGRDEIQINMDEIGNFIKDKVVMVTGAAGSIGSELVRQISRFGVSRIILFDNAETPMHNLRLELDDKFKWVQYEAIVGDVRSENRLRLIFERYHPQIVFHAAAYKHVPLMEANPCEAVRVNVRGSKLVADMCLKFGVEKMVMISTDKAVNPTNIMGCSKRIAEIYVQSLGVAVEKGLVEGTTKFVTTRFGNVLGSNGSVIPRFREQIENGGPVTVTHPDITRFFMTIPEACRLVMEAATMSTGNQIFVFDMGESVKIDDLARKMIRLSGNEVGPDGIDIQYCGLRPGEKLYEEVLSNTENTLETSHPRIRIAKVREYEYDYIKEEFVKLNDYAREINVDELVKLMKKIVPEYKSKNSIFEKFD